MMFFLMAMGAGSGAPANQGGGDPPPGEWVRLTGELQYNGEPLVQNGNQLIVS
jgi:hypothetical protein